jgi:hypothetical protein
MTRGRPRTKIYNEDNIKICKRKVGDKEYTQIYKYESKKSPLKQETKKKIGELNDDQVQIVLDFIKIQKF